MLSGLFVYLFIGNWLCSTMTFWYAGMLISTIIFCSVTFRFIYMHHQSLCNATNQTIIIGSGIASRWLHVLMFDKRLLQTVVYLIPIENIFPLAGKILINKQTVKRSMQEMFNFEPVFEGQFPESCFVMQGSKPNETLLTFFYGRHAESAISVSSVNKIPYYSMKTNNTSNGIIWNSDQQGLHLMRGATSFEGWLARDVTFVNQQLWFGSHVFRVLFTGSNEFEFRVSIQTADESYARWPAVSGFVAGNLYVFLFAERKVYLYLDPLVSDSHPIGDYRFEFVKLDYNEIFWCTENKPSTELRRLDPQVAEDNSKVYLILALFSMHFVVSLLMVALIIMVNIRDSNFSLYQLSDMSSATKSITSDQIDGIEFDENQSYEK